MGFCLIAVDSSSSCILTAVQCFPGRTHHSLSLPQWMASEVVSDSAIMTGVSVAILLNVCWGTDRSQVLLSGQLQLHLGIFLWAYFTTQEH